MGCIGLSHIYAIPSSPEIHEGRSHCLDRGISLRKPSTDNVLQMGIRASGAQVETGI